MAVTDTLKVGKGELQAQSQTILGYAGQMDQTLAQTQSRVQSLLDFVARPRGQRFQRPLRPVAPRGSAMPS